MGFVTPSFFEENLFLEAAKVSHPTQPLGPPTAFAPLPQAQRWPLGWYPTMHHRAIRQRCHLPTLIRPRLRGAFSWENKQSAIQGMACPARTAPLAVPHCVSLRFPAERHETYRAVYILVSLERCKPDFWHLCGNYPYSSRLVF